MAERNVQMWQELRFVAQEVGLTEAKKMPIEIRRWWIEQMQRDKAPQEREAQGALGGNRVVPK